MEKKNSFIKDLLEVVISVAIITFLLVNYVIMPCEVNGSSMYPTLKENDRTYSFIITRKFGIKRFDICVIETQNDGNERLLVKRVIGMPNETIVYINNKLYIDGAYYEEPFLDDVYTEDFSITLGEDEYYCLGDNREISNDSRSYGPFSKNSILNSHIFIFYPFNRVGFHK